MQRNKLFLAIVLVFFSVISVSWTIKENPSLLNNTKPYFKGAKAVLAKDYRVELIYDSLSLDSKGLSRTAFEYAIEGFQKLDRAGLLQNDSIITIIDFDQPSYNKRMYVIDLRNYRIVFNTWAAHGRNTGKEIAQYFSNANQSLKSSLGFYITDKTYYGSNGYSLKLIGLEKGVNDMALKRAIVLHGAPYVSQSFIDAQGYIGRSWGCPAVPMALCRPIIETIKEGSCLFIYNRSYKSDGNFQSGFISS